MAYNRPDPQVHRWFIPGKYLRHAVNSMLARIFSLFAIFFMQLWGKKAGMIVGIMSAYLFLSFLLLS